MDISYLGKSSFRIKGKGATVITDGSSFKFEVEKEVKLSVSAPGEYEVGGISAIGTKFGANNVFVFEVENLRVGYLGDFSEPISDEKISQMGSIDVLILNVGNSAKESVKVVSATDPFFVIPFSEKEPVETYLSESGLTVERIDKFSLKKEDILEDQSTKAIVLEKK